MTAIAAMTADTHLRPGAWAGRPGITGDSYFSFQQFFTYAVDHELPAVLAGDVFDVNTPDSVSVKTAVTWIERLHEVGQLTFFVEGQHEMARVPWLTVATGSVHAHRLLWEVAGVRFYGLNFTRQDGLAAALDGVPPGTDVFVGHQVWREWMGSVANPEGSLKDVPYVKLVVTGDFHGHRCETVNRTGGGKLVAASPGSTCLQDLTEDPAKYFFVLHDDLTVQSVPFLTRPLLRYRVAVADHLDHLVDSLPDVVGQAAEDARLPDAIRKPIVEVEVVSSAISGTRARLERAVGASAHLVVKLRGRRADDPDDTPDAADSSAASARRARMSAGLAGYVADAAPDDTAVQAACNRLIAAVDVRGVADAIVKESLQAGGWR